MEERIGLEQKYAQLLNDRDKLDNLSREREYEVESLKRQIRDIEEDNQRRLSLLKTEWEINIKTRLDSDLRDIHERNASELRSLQEENQGLNRVLSELKSRHAQQIESLKLQFEENIKNKLVDKDFY